jgi:tetratricopeptide (TPR) repeat protein
LFEIPIDISIDKFSYADISSESAFGPAEKEVLFTMGTIFRIISVTRENNEDVWIVQLKLSDEEDKHLHRISSIIKKDVTEPYKPLIKLIRIMCRMQYLKEAEHFSLLALEDKSVTSDFDLLSLIYYQLGIIYKSTGKINEAMVYFKKTLNMKYENNVSPTDPSLSNLYTNLGIVYEDIGEYDRAHTYHNLALKVLSDAETVNQADLAIKYSNIASVCRKKEYYLQALQNYTNCLEIELEILLPNDKKLLITKNNIGIVHIQLENYTKAIEHFQKIFETEQNLFEYPNSNPALAVIYWNLACAFYQQRQLVEALQYFRKCESIVTNKVNLILHGLRVKECKDWIQRIEDELSKESHQIQKGYGPDPWLMSHPYNMSFTFE